MDPHQLEDQFIGREFECLIVDTDAGADDSQALLVLFHLCRKYHKKLLGITIVNGNTIIENVTANVLITQALCGENYPLYLGEDCSLSGGNEKDSYFGDDGLGNKQAKYLEQFAGKIDKSLVQKDKAFLFIAQKALEFKGKIALICLGPLTNVAKAYHYENSVVDCFSSVNVMGCSDTLIGLNSNYTAEFNINLDPEAAHIVFKKYRNILLFSLDTCILGVNHQHTDFLFHYKETKKGAFIADIYSYIQQKPYLLCDPLAVLGLFRQDAIRKGTNINLRIEVKGKRTRGATLIDYFGKEHTFYNAYLVKEMNVEQFAKEILESYQD